MDTMQPHSDNEHDVLTETRLFPDADRDMEGPTFPTETLQNMNLDIFLIVLELLRPQKKLRPLSMTCKWIRDACVPILFRSCTVRSWRLRNGLSESFPPPVLWNYVKSLKFLGDFYLANFGPDFRPMWEVLEMPFSLLEALQSFPLLDSVSLELGNGGSGIHWNVLETIVGVPRLRFLSFMGPVACPEFIPPTICLKTVATLRKIWYNVNEFRKHPRSCRGENALFARLTRAARDTLESICMPSECFPYEVVYANELRNLRELYLKGERIVVLTGEPGSRTVTPLISILARLPSLRTLRLHLAHPGNLPDRDMIWPRGIVGRMPWPELETLSVSYPHPDDALYEHLPESLRMLSLRCWPRHYVPLIDEEDSILYDLQWIYPVLRSSEMLRLLRKCASLQIRELDIEVEEDNEDLELFGYVAKAFPNLTSLTVYRYRAQGRYEIPVEAIAIALSPLSELVSLRVHLDFKNMPHPLAMHNRHGKEEFGNFRMTLEAAANVFARRIPSLKIVYLLQRVVCNTYWIPFEVSPTRSVSVLPNGSSHWENLPYQDADGPGYIPSGRRYVVKR